MAPAARGSARRTVGARTGGRSKRVVDDVLRAAAHEIAQRGYAGLRVEDVATRAGVNKTSIYRRWPTKKALVAAAIVTAAGHDEPLPDTGALRGDLVAMLVRAASFALTVEGRAISRLIHVEAGDPEVDLLVRSLRERIVAQRSEVLARAERRGELPVGVDAKLVLDAIFLPVMTRALRYREEVDLATIEAFVDLAIFGAQQGAGAPRKAC